jgi:hypothetical protein
MRDKHTFFDKIVGILSRIRITDQVDCVTILKMMGKWAHERTD